MDVTRLDKSAERSADLVLGLLDLKGSGSSIKGGQVLGLESVTVYLLLSVRKTLEKSSGKLAGPGVAFCSREALKET
jgi:hypothetical protein